jgi:hypothetical protein
MTLRPHPRVRVISWSKEMRLKRRHEVQIAQAPWCDGDEVPIARFTARSKAKAYAAVVREVLLNKGKGVV